MQTSLTEHPATGTSLLSWQIKDLRRKKDKDPIQQECSSTGGNTGPLYTSLRFRTLVSEGCLSALFKILKSPQNVICSITRGHITLGAKMSASLDTMTPLQRYQLFMATTTVYLNTEETWRLLPSVNKCSFLKPCCICLPDMPTKKKRRKYVDTENNMKHMYHRLHCSFTLNFWFL